MAAKDDLGRAGEDRAVAHLIGDGYRIIAASRGKEGGQLLSFRSDDLKTWRYEGVYKANIGEMAECPDAFELDGQKVVITSIIGHAPELPGYQTPVCWVGHEEDGRFVEGFVNASFTVCIGAMAIVGSINDGLYGDYTILAAKSILDFIIIMVMAASLGKGTIFSAIPVALLQGGVTALSVLIQPIMTERALLYLSVIGNILIFCVGINLVFGKKIRVANLLPAIVLAVACAFLPVAFI